MHSSKTIVDTKEQDAIYAVVNKVMANKKMNSIFIPDVVERQIYYNLLSFCFAGLKEVLQGTKIEFLDHIIRIDIEPSAPLPSVVPEPTAPIQN